MKPKNKKVNKYGLKRDIPASVKREIRQRCGFGCVKCGSPFVSEYHHMDPPFSEAKEHKADSITLLCKTCHGFVTAGMVSELDVALWNDKPFCIQSGHARAVFGAGLEEPMWSLGSNIFYGKFQLADLAAGRLDPPCEGRQDWRLTLSIRGQRGRPMLEIIENEWTVGVEDYDLLWEGNTLKIWSKKGNIILDLTIASSKIVHVSRLYAENSDERLEIKDGFLMMIPKEWKSFKVSLNEGEIVVNRPSMSFSDFAIEPIGYVNGFEIAPDKSNSVYIINRIRMNGCVIGIIIWPNTGYVVYDTEFENVDSAFAYRNRDGSYTWRKPQW